VRIAIFSLRFLGGLARKKWRLVFRLEFLVLFVQAKRTEETLLDTFRKSIVTMVLNLICSRPSTPRQWSGAALRTTLELTKNNNLE
jgi:hypothetical protein